MVSSSGHADGECGELDDCHLPLVPSFLACPSSIPEVHHSFFPTDPLGVLQVSLGPLGPEPGRPSMGSPAYTREGCGASSQPAAASHSWE